MNNPSFSPKKKALLIAVMDVCGKSGSKFEGLPGLAFAHRDARELREFLITSYDYKAEDIVLMLDDVNHQKHLWPTRHNILRQIDLLTSDPAEGCHYFFYYSGHGLEEEIYERACMRADGRDDEIVCADGKPILDYELHNRLIKPLEKVKDSKLFALFDCCHSENLLDLQKGSKPNYYSRAWPMGAGQHFKALATVVGKLLKSVKYNSDRKREAAPTPLRRSSTGWRSLPRSRTQEIGELSVICLSACRDRQFARDDNKRELTFTKCFIDTVSSKPKITWSELRDELQKLISEIRMSYEEECAQESLLSASTGQDARYSTSSHTDLSRVVSI